MKMCQVSSKTEDLTRIFNKFVPGLAMYYRCLVNEYVPSEHVFDLAALDALDVVVELE